MKRAFLILLLLGHFIFLTAQKNVSSLGNLTYSNDLSDVWGYADESENEYALVGVYNGLSIVDVTDPGNPEELFFISGPSSIWRDIKVWQGFAYETNETSGGLRIYDLNELPDTVTYSNWDVTWNSQTLESAHNIFIDENGFAYVVGANIGIGGALILDLNIDPENPSLEGVYDTRYIHDCYVRGDTMWTAEISEGIFSVVDVSDKSNPVVLATQSTPSNFTHNVWIGNNGSVLYTTDEVSSAFIGAYDVSDLSNITKKDDFRSNPGSGVIPHNVFINGDFAVISYYRDGVVIVDVSNAGNMVEAGHYDTSPLSGNGFNGCWGVYPYLPSGNILASDIEGGLFILQPDYVHACFIEGMVTDSSTGFPLNDVNIEVSAASISTTTDISGNYSAGTIDSGLYDVVFAKSGYKLKTIHDVSFQNGLTTTLDVELKPAVSYTLTGTVKEETSNDPIPDAVVLFSNSVSEFTTTTDQNGAFSIPDFPAEEYTAVAGKWGYRTKNLSLELPPGSSVDFQLQAGYQDGFHLDLGWIDSTTATTGKWERGVPIGTEYNGSESNPYEDVTTDIGDKCYVTGNGGGVAALDDIDNGISTLISPPMDLSGFSDPYLQFYYWFYTGGGNGVFNDTLKFFLSNGISKAELFRVDASGLLSQWNKAKVKVNDFILPTSEMRFIVEASDLPGSGHLVEAGLDFFFAYDSIFCAAPASHSSAMLNSNDVRLEWNMQPDAEGYIIEGKAIDETSFTTIILPSSSNFYKVKNLPGNKTYVWRIQTVCSASEETKSEFTGFDTIELYCNPPLNLHVTNISSNSAILNWDAVNGALNYNILGRETGTSQIVSITVNSSATSYSATSLKPSTTYEWSVRQACDVENSVFVYSDIPTPGNFTTASLKSNDFVNSIQVYPNPAKGVLYLNGKADFIRIYDTQNRLILAKETSNSNVFDIKELKSGIYILKVLCGSNWETLRFIKL